MRLGAIAIVATLIGGAALSAAAAGTQGSAPGPGWRGRGPGMFDRSSITTISGAVSAVERFDRGPVQSVNLVVQSNEGEVSILLGPSWYIDQQSVKFENGQAVVVTGSKLTFDGKSMIVAQTVKSGDQTITLRDADGLPAWGGPARGGPPGWRGGPGFGPRETGGAQTR
jgi:hypothetical protein